MNCSALPCETSGTTEVPAAASTCTDVSVVGTGVEGGGLRSILQTFMQESTVFELFTCVSGSSYTVGQYIVYHVVPFSTSFALPTFSYTHAQRLSQESEDEAHRSTVGVVVDLPDVPLVALEQAFPHSLIHHWFVYLLPCESSVTHVFLQESKSPGQAMVVVVLVVVLVPA